ncbi:profilin-like [Salvia hispanica]|uniref:profilin-like n=1 Tax=Salvia hispanica TaxID=49212 RepID=UPI002009AE73|nr:profilin-like [Salvia hispanica]
MWLQSYIYDQLRSDIGYSYFLSSIAMVSHDGAILAQTFNFPKLKPNEVTSMMNEFDNPGTLAPTGLQIGGSSYFVIRGEPDAIIRGTGKNMGHNVTIKKTTLGLIVCMMRDFVVFRATWLSRRWVIILFNRAFNCWRDFGKKGLNSLVVFSSW